MTKISLSPLIARQLAVMAQHLDGVYETADKATMLAVIQQLGCLQIDPINVVARNPLLVLWSRLGPYDVADLEALLWQDKTLFEYWAHAASIVLADDYPIHHMMMHTYGQGDSKWSQKVRNWAEANDVFRQYILDELARRGPLFADEFEDKAAVPWRSSGWTAARNVTMMLDFLWTRGTITVSRRQGAGFGLKKQWALMTRHLPQWRDHEPLPPRELVSLAVEKSLKALGVGTEKQIRNHFVRGRYPGLSEILPELVASGRVHPLTIPEINDDIWYIHDDDLPALERLRRGEWQPSTRLLSPFDNLICDRDRTQELFEFYYRSEIYTPKAKRQYGYYVMPILRGEKLIGRIDPKMDRKKKHLLIHAVHAEPDAPKTAAPAIAQAITDLAQFLGAKQIVYSKKIPAIWRKALQ
jgi:uncharacterized protein YcaQ